MKWMKDYIDDDRDIIKRSDPMINNKQDVAKKDDQVEELYEVAKPLIRYLAEKHHPHVTAIVTSTSVELLEGILCKSKIHDFLRD